MALETILFNNEIGTEIAVMVRENEIVLTVCESTSATIHFKSVKEFQDWYNLVMTFIALGARKPLRLQARGGIAPDSFFG